MPEFDRPGEFPDASEEDRRWLFEAGALDMGGGRAAIALDDAVVDACRESREFCAEVIAKSRTLVESIKGNGADFEGTWAAFMALAKNVETIREGSYALFAYLLAESVFKDAADKEAQR